MLEGVNRVRRRAAAERQARRDQRLDTVGELRFRRVGDSSKQRMSELAADHGADLRDLLRRRKPVEPRDQRGLQRRRDLSGAALPSG